MTNAIRAPFPWFGGKAGHKIKDAILSALPPHKRYLEPFGGGASILARHVSPSAGLCGLFALEDDKRNAQGFQRLCERMSAGCTER